MVIKTLVEEKQNDFDFSIFCIESPLGPWGEELVKSGFKVTSESRGEKLDFRLIRKLRAYIKSNKIDIVHCHQYTPWVYGALASLFTRANVVFTEHGRFYPDSTSWKRRLMNPLLIKLTSAFTAISASTRHSLNKFEFISTKKVQLIYNGIVGLKCMSSVNSSKVRDDLDIPRDAVVYGTVARLDPIKNHMLMLEAFAKLAKVIPNTYLVIVGDGEERQRIEKRVVLLGLTERVKLVGYKSDPSAYIHSMDVFLLSSLSEGASMTLLEAMSVGKPCVVTDAGGNAEIIKNSYNGIVTENNHLEAFVNAMKVFQCDKIREMMGNNGKKRFEENFTAKIMKKNYLNLYEIING